MGIALVPHIKNQPVRFKVKDPVEGYGQFYGTQIGGQVSAASGNILNQFFPQLLTKRSGLLIVHCMQLCQGVFQADSLLSKKPASAKTNGQAKQGAEEYLKRGVSQQLFQLFDEKGGTHLGPIFHNIV